MTIKVGDKEIEVFEREPIYWFLKLPFNKIEKLTGKKIDLYGDTEFSSLGQLNILKEVLFAEFKSIKKENFPLDVEVGKIGFKIIFEKLLFQDLENDLNIIFEMIELAKEKNLSLIFIGD